MRSWARSPVEFTCGCCGLRIASGSPMLRFVIPGLKHAKLRCVDCAGEPVPVDLPMKVPGEVRHIQLTEVDEDGIERPIRASRSMTPVRKLAGLALDWRQKAAGE